MILTTSWDDGHPLNSKLLDLLNKFDLKGTFYIQGRYAESHQPEILKLAASQEIGAHTYSHLDLTKLDSVEAQQEIIKSKKILTGILDQQIRLFAYPFGKFNQDVQKQVKKAGFWAARTTQTFELDNPKNLFEWGTALHVYPHPFRKKDAKKLHGPKVILQPLQKSYKNIIRLKLPITSFFSWFNLAKNLFDYSYKRNKIYHLWGHAWEIEKYGMWQDLEQLIRYIKNFDNNIEYLTNSQVIERFKA